MRQISRIFLIVFQNERFSQLCMEILVKELFEDWKEGHSHLGKEIMSEAGEEEMNELPRNWWVIVFIWSVGNAPRHSSSPPEAYFLDAMMNMKRYPSQGKVDSSSSVGLELEERKPPIPRQRTSLRRYANDWTDYTAKRSLDIYENLRTDGEYCEIVNGGDGENIYENICDKCGRIYSGDQCSECFKPTSKSSKKFVDFFGSLKRKNKVCVRKNMVADRRKEPISIIDTKRFIYN